MTGTPNDAKMSDYVRSDGTDAQLSNEIASVVIDVMTADGRTYVPWSVRYGIAHELQRRGLSRAAFKVGDYVEWPDFHMTGWLVRFQVVDNERIWIVADEERVGKEFSAFEGNLRRIAQKDTNVD